MLELDFEIVCGVDFLNACALSVNIGFHTSHKVSEALIIAKAVPARIMEDVKIAPIAAGDSDIKRGDGRIMITSNRVIRGD